MINFFRKAALATAVVAAIPALVSAQAIAYRNAPVSVTSCATTETTGFLAPVSIGGLFLHSSSDLALSYVNTANIPATSVTFLVNDGTQARSVVANGRFAPGVNISRTFSEDTAAHGVASCSVARVHFADGSVWEADADRIVSSR